MNALAKKAPFLILGVTSLVCSKILFSLFNDPEGPNLLIVTGMAVILYMPSLTAYTFNSSISGFKKFLLALFIQILLATGFYVWLH